MEDIKRKVKIIIQKVTGFLQEAKMALKKSYLADSETNYGFYAVVIILVFVISLILGIIDFAPLKRLNLF